MKILDLRSRSKQEIIKEACAVLAAGGLVIYPTETTYGIGADATNQQAVDKLLKYKKRRQGKPLSIVVADQIMAEQYVELNDNAKQVYATFLPGPVTVVSKSKNVVVNGVASETGTIGVRIPNYPLVIEIAKQYGKPFTATGANASYKKRPYTIQDIFSNISERQKKLIDLVLDAGELPHNEPSTVVDTTLDELSVLRQGSVSFTEKNEIVTHNEEETIALGGKLMQKYCNLLSYKAVIFCLEGEMGVGKTHFTKGIAQALQIKRMISSPTYTLSREYQFEAEGSKLQLVHIDTWRLAHAEELLQLGFEHMVDHCNVIVIEWADRVVDALKQFSDEAKIVWVKIAYGKKENDRTISYSDKPEL